MFCRAKIGVVLALAGTLSGWAAPLNLEQKNPALLRDGLVSPGVLKPSQTNAKFGTASRWHGLKVRKIPSATKLTPKVRIDGFVITKGAGPANIPSKALLNATAKK